MERMITLFKKTSLFMKIVFMRCHGCNADLKLDFMEGENEKIMF